MRYLYVLLLLLLAAPLCAQTGDCRGREFWFAFPANARAENNSGYHLFLFATGDPSTKITYTANKKSNTITIGKSGSVQFEVDSLLEIMEEERAVKKAIHVTSTDPINLLAVSRRFASTDSYTILPVDALGTDYWAIGQKELAFADASFTTQFEIVATENKTSVSITPSGVTSGGHKRDSTYTIMLSQGDVYHVSSPKHSWPSDLTGSHITSNKPVAFITGHRCAQIPASTNFCDVLIEMEPPATSFGTEFVAIPFLANEFDQRTRYSIRVLATQDGSIVTINDKSIDTLARGAFFDVQLSTPAVIHVSYPALVAQYANGSEDDTIKVGDPFMILLTPTQGFVRATTFTTPFNFGFHEQYGVPTYFKHFLTVVSPSNAKLTLDAKLIRLKPLGQSGYSFLQMQISEGIHKLESDSGFASYLYGFGSGIDNYDSYGHTIDQKIER